MSKMISMGGAELTEEQREAIKKFQDSQAKAQQDRLEKQIQMSQVEREVLIKKLLNTTVRPHEDRVIVYPDPPEVVTVGGILIPADVQNKQRPSHGTVIAVGPGKVDAQDVTNYLLLNMLIALHAPQEQIDEAKSEIGSLLVSPLKPGDRIMFGKYAGTPVEDPETKEELLIMRPTDIFVTL